MNRKLTGLQKRTLKSKAEQDIIRRYFERNWEAMSWCNKQGLTIYTSAQANNSVMVKIFIQKGVNFKPLNNILYSQAEPEDMMKCVAAIDLRYEQLYLRMKKN